MSDDDGSAWGSGDESEISLSGPYSPLSYPTSPVQHTTFLPSGFCLLEQLPLELHRLILQHLAGSDLVSLLCTSSSLYQIAIHQLYRSITFSLKAIYPERNRTLLAALKAPVNVHSHLQPDGRTHQSLVYRITIRPQDEQDSPEALIRPTYTCFLDEIEELLATTPQLEAVVYTRSCYDLEGKGRTLAGVAAVAALKELRFLNLGAVQSVDGGLALTGLLGLAATFSLIPETAVGEEGASKLSLFERTEFPVGLRPFSDAGVDNVGVVVRTISGSQKTLGGLVLDTGADNEMCSQAIAPRVAMPIFNFRVYFRQPVCGLVTTSAITGLFAGLRLERLKRLALVRWDVGGEATSHLIAAVNFSQLEELRLVDCVGLQSLFLRLQAGGTKLEKLRSLALTAWEDDIVFVLGKLVSNGRLNDLYLHVLPGNPDGYYNRPEMFPPSPELLSALVGLGGQLEKLEIDALVSREPNKFLVFDADSLGVLMNAFINLRDLAITVDTDKNWPKILEHLSVPKHLHRIHLCQHQHQHQTDGMARSIINANWLNKHNKRAHPQLALMSTPDYPHYFEHQLRYSPQLDAYARAVMLDMVETILLPCCTQAPLDREFDFFKDSRLRVVGMTFLTSAGKCVMAEYAIKADRMFVSWSLRAQREKELASKSELELLVGAKVVVGGWNIGLEAIAKKEGRKEPWRTEWGMGVLFGKRY